MHNSPNTALHKPELAEKIADQAQLTRTQAHEVITAFTDQVAAAMARGETVALAGFGSFRVRERQARSGRNPRTGEAMEIPAHKTVGFRPGKAFREAIE